MLDSSRVEFKPSMINLTQMVNVVSKDVIALISVVPRLDVRPSVLARFHGFRFHVTLARLIGALLLLCACSCAFRLLIHACGIFPKW